jgi:cytoskeletal protein RodZ
MSVTPGNELRTARERLNLSREEISARTKIQVRKIAALEDDAYEQLPAGIYLDGIAAAYAREVGLDAEPFVRRVRTHVAPPPSVTLEHIAAVRHPAPVDRRRGTERMTVTHGMAAFAAVALLLVVAGTGVHFYPWLFSTAPQGTTVVATVSEAEPAATPQSDSQLRWEQGTTGAEPIPQPAPELTGPPTVARPAPGAVVADLEPPGPILIEVPRPVEIETTTPAKVVRRTPGTQAVDRRDVIQGRAVQERHAPPIVAEQKTIEALAATDSMPTETAPVPQLSSLTGVWTLETEIESTSFKAFEGLRLGYRLELRQEGDRIEGTGLKVAENGVALSAARRTPITVHGTLGEGRVRLVFGEQGARRRTTGIFELVIDEDGVLRGGFASEAARSAGAVKARRL